MKKKTLLLILVMLSTLTASAKTLIDGIYYNLDTKAKQAEVTCGDGYGDSEYTGSVTIPATVTYNDVTYSVTSIGGGAFQVGPWQVFSGLTSVTIPNSVTSIGEYAFQGCSGLTSMTIPNSVTSIGKGAFSGCSGMPSVTIPNSVTSIGEWTFSGCSGLTSIEISNSVTSIGEDAFSYCSGLTSISVEKGNTAYDSRDNCNAIIETASNALIVGCMNTVIPNSVTSIGKGAFENCSGLTSVKIPNSVTSIGNYAFEGCTGLTEVTSEITEPFTFGTYAFDYISSNCVLKVPYGTKSAYIAKGWTTSVFKGGLKEVLPEEFCGINYEFDSNTKQATVIASDIKYTGSVTIPSTVTYKGVTYSVTSIGNSAFSDCSDLTSVTIPNSVTVIGDEAFYFCSGLTSMTIPNSVTSIGSFAFSDCTGLTDVFCYAENVPSTVSSAFSYTPISYVTLHVPAGSVEEYKTADPWSGFGNIVKIQNCVNGIYYNFDTNTKQAEVTYLNEILSNPDAYKGSVTIPETVTYNDVTYSVTSIGEWAFGGSSGLTEVVIPNSVTSIGDWAFFNCSGLKEVTIPSSVTSIGHGAFSIWSGLTDVYCYAGNVPTTDSDAFSNNYIPSVTLHVPAGSVEAYKTTSPWSGFGSIVAIEGMEPEIKKCATPTIALADGELQFSCETEGVQIVSKITCSDTGEYEGFSVPLTKKYTVTAYAKKDGYDDSDVATKEIEVGGGGSTAKKGDVNEDGQVNGTDIQEVINIIVEGE